jgi:phosphohistidine phosphatase
MRTLILMRHAKSSWDDPSLADFDRPLNERGVRTAPLMGDVMRREGLSPDVILSSTANRARQTAESARAAARIAVDPVFDGRIYEASPIALRQVVSEIDDRHGTAMLVGHNPGMEGFVQYLTGRIEPMPTAAIAVIELDISRWRDVSSDSGRLLRVFRPKELISS